MPWPDNETKEKVRLRERMEILLGIERFEDAARMFRSKREDSKEESYKLAGVLSLINTGALDEAEQEIDQLEFGLYTDKLQGLVEERRGNLEAALSHLERVPAYQDSDFRNMARVLEAMEDYQEAAPLWERAFYHSKFVRVDDLLRAAHCWRKMGNPKRAEYLEREVARWQEKHKNEQTVEIQPVSQSA